MPTEWLISTTDADTVQRLSEGLGISAITARILINRGIANARDAGSYLDPSLSDIPDPFLIPDMSIAVERIVHALKTRERIAIFGDYDVDGITGTALLASFLRAVGQDTIVELPDRMGEGYGLTIGAIKNLASRGATLIITVDNGTRAVSEIAEAGKRKIDVIVTDHHDAGGPLPPALAIVNPQRNDSPQAYRNLSGCGVAFMLAMALRKRLREARLTPSPEPNLKLLLDLVALGTIADVVPLSGVNRILVRHGLFEIARGARPGIRALIEVSSTNALNISPDAVAFQLAPRINAAGRIGDPKIALDLMMSDDASASMDIARSLDRANRERQKIESQIIDEAFGRIESDDEIKGRAAIVIASRGWHVGVIGIAAAKIAQRFRRPTAVISLDSVPARGSVRGIEGMNLVEALGLCDDILTRFGGHAMAAGLSIEEERIDAFANRLDEVCRRMATDAKPSTLPVDAVVAAADVTLRLIEELISCRPFGQGNPEPILAMHGVEVVERRILSDKHLKLKVRSGGTAFDAIGFSMADRLPPDAKRVSLAFCPEFNTWNGMTSVQLKLKDIKSAPGHL